ncbi:SLATT domain-containing protein [Eisenibacter elegans]|jgi:hypothetical protein|uniref:SLATT domain-containing protein n=1 Tax=Eisenibacter elegans TaxID=997 RepID=UPI0004152873|nr:SLATT domain-containing protein [Eisenibacter elegans]
MSQTTDPTNPNPEEDPIQAFARQFEDSSTTNPDQSSGSVDQDPFQALASAAGEGQQAIPPPEGFGQQSTPGQSCPYCQNTLGVGMAGGGSAQQHFGMPYQALDTSAIQQLLAAAQQNYGATATTRQYREHLDSGKSDIRQLADELLGKKDRVPVEDPEERAEIERKIKFLQEEIAKMHKLYDRRRHKTRLGALFFRLISTALAALVTILLGINITGVLATHEIILGLKVDWFINTIALVISAFLTVLSDLRAFYDSDALRAKYTETSYKLSQIRALLEYLTLGGAFVTLDEVNRIKYAFDKILEDTANYAVKVSLDDLEQDRTSSQYSSIR